MHFSLSFHGKILKFPNNCRIPWIDAELWQGFVYFIRIHIYIYYHNHWCLIGDFGTFICHFLLQQHIGVFLCSKFTVITVNCMGIILGMVSANERRCNIVSHWLRPYPKMITVTCSGITYANICSRVVNIITTITMNLARFQFVIIFMVPIREKLYRPMDFFV